MTILITGAGGFIGRHLIEALLHSGQGPLAGLDQNPPAKFPVKFFCADLRDDRAAAEAIGRIQPERIYHLAGYSSNARSFSEPATVIRDNLGMAVNLLGAVAKLDKPCRTLLLSTAQVYGDARGRLREEDRPAPLSPYALSKLGMEEVARFYHRTCGLDLVVTRAANQFGPGQSDEYVVSSFARQLLELKMGLRRAELEVGNLKAKRDFIDVRDAVSGYLLLMEKAEAGQTYNLAQGRNLAIEDLLFQMIEFCGLERSHIKIRVSAGRLRPEPKAEAVISVARIRKLGFRPRIKLETSLRDLLDYWGRVCAKVVSRK